MALSRERYLHLWRRSPRAAIMATAVAIAASGFLHTAMMIPGNLIQGIPIVAD